MEEIKEEFRKRDDYAGAQGINANQYKPLQGEQQYIQSIPQNKKEAKVSRLSDFMKRIKKEAGIFMLVAVLGLVFYDMTNSSATVDKSPEAVEAIETHMSTTLGAGTRLMSEDERYIGGDLTVIHSSSDDETTIYVWDYAAEDGDYVQIIVDGVPMGEPFMIRNKPVSFTVPTVGEMQIKGTRDGGGGITYGVYYEVNHTTYFNGMDVGGDNLYTLIRE